MLCSLAFNHPVGSGMRFYPRLTILVAMPVGAQLVRNGSVTVAVGYHVVHVLITVLLLFVLYKGVKKV